MNTDLREYAWRYFTIHADQRIKTFHFFIIISTVIMGAPLTVIQKDGLICYASVLAYLLSFLAYIFWKLDIRNRELIKHAEEALVTLEQKMDVQGELDETPPVVLLFSSERWKTKMKKKCSPKSVLPDHMSYSDCFNAVFMVIGVIGYIEGTMFALIIILK